ncbi:MULTISPECIES: DNA (cytosine-5-)-methyltransferase [unclassified Streptomyces]|uniref:DNA cytosine methyltransferase n=1 Tax=unclassified Streptomyces TaxID=2593676 RepID=UPI0023663F65|nr:MULTISPECIES: DNA (cytosine-5-)-methyltransferase [unclassified Streptomyces]MDF3141598.1 DNA (cytosine-5-)-methyltransferase [Streptomyces sp. T21Q-yed]WDF38387.1 DNA (cytosine-5-)-methyltransferase [Streptomyces sp. T12]
MLSSENLTSLEICAGGGGQAIGVERAGFHHLALVERKAEACATLRLNRPSWSVIQKDLREFEPQRDAGIGTVDLLAGGVPCTPYSIAGAQKGAADERDLLPEALRLVEILLPRAVMLENVKTLARSREFIHVRNHIVETLENLGYEVHIDVLDAQNFGVSQTRQRTLIVAVQKGLKKFQWPIGSWELPYTVGEVLQESMQSGGWPGAAEWASLANDIAPTIVGGSEKHGGGDLGPERAKQKWAKMAVNGNSTAAQVPGPDFVLQHGVGRGGRKGYPKLTPEQVALLQGFPREWQFAGSRTARYKQIGNAFPPPVAHAVAASIADVLRETSTAEAA